MSNHKYTKVMVVLKKGTPKSEYQTVKLIKEFTNTFQMDLEVRNGRFHIPKHKLN